MNLLPALPRDKDQSLSQALSPLLAEFEARDHDPHVTTVRKLEARAAEYAPMPAAMDPRLVRALGLRGIEQLYTHQAAAIGHALDGRNVVVVTPTASGKTLCYNAPILQHILADPSTRALYLFPTKALAQDQLAELHQLAEIVGAEGGGEIGVFTYDGDTPQDARRAIRTRANAEGAEHRTAHFLALAIVAHVQRRLQREPGAQPAMHADVDDPLCAVIAVRSPEAHFRSRTAGKKEHLLGGEHRFGLIGQVANARLDAGAGLVRGVVGRLL